MFENQLAGTRSLAAIATERVAVAVDTTQLVEVPGARRGAGSTLSRPGRRIEAGETLWDPLKPPQPENKAAAAITNHTAIA